MRKLNWIKVGDLKIKGTVWEEKAIDTSVSIDIDELEALFGSQPAATGSSLSLTKPKEEAAKPAALALIDPKRAQSISTVLGNLKSMKLEQPKVMRALVDADLGLLENGRMSVEQVLTLIHSATPQPDEVEALEGFDQSNYESLRDVEQWLITLLHGVPNLSARTAALVNRAQFSDVYRDQHEVVSRVLQTARQIRHSPSLVHLLSHTLAYGNYLNGTSRTGGAYWFKLSVLSELTSTKSVDGTSTLLHYLARRVSTAAEDGGSLVSAVKAELSCMDEPVRFEWSIVSAEIDGVNRGIKAMESLVAKDQVAAFTSSMGVFLTDAQAKMQELVDMRKMVNELCAEMGCWFVADKVDKEPEKFFGLIGSFIKALDTADKFNKEASAREEKKRKRAEKAAREAESAKSRPKESGRKGGNGPDLVAALANRRRFVDDVEEGIAGGIVRRHGR